MKIFDLLNARLRVGNVYTAEGTFDLFSTSSAASRRHSARSRWRDRGHWVAADIPALPAVVLADGTNLGLARMADASRDLGYLHLVNVAQWHRTHR